MKTSGKTKQQLITAEYPHYFNLLHTVRSIYRNIRSHGFLIRLLMRIELTAQFKKTILGQSWLLINPLINLAIWLLFKYSGVFQPGNTGIAYPAYLLLSLSLWTFFVGFFEYIGNSLTQSARILREVQLPVEVIVAQKVAANWVSFAIPLLLNIVVLLLFGVRFTLSSLLFIPALFPLMLLGVLLGLFFSLIEVVAHDIYLLFRRSLKLLMYLTPVVYSQSIESQLLQTIMHYNPLTSLLVLPRNLLVGIPVGNWSNFALWTGIVVILFIVVLQLFYHSARYTIERIV